MRVCACCNGENVVGDPKFSDPEVDGAEVFI